MEDRATFRKLELNDGQEVEMCLTFGRLLKLREKCPETYKKYNKLAMDGVQEEVDFPVFLYTGYLCANIENVEDCMSEEEFFDKLPENHAAVIGTVMKLRYGESKKKTGFKRGFLKRKPKNRVQMPKFKLEDIEDYYTYYVVLIGVSEDLFWNSDISSVGMVAENKTAYENWLAAVREK